MSDGRQAPSIGRLVRASDKRHAHALNSAQSVVMPCFSHMSFPAEFATAAKRSPVENRSSCRRASTKFGGDSFAGGPMLRFSANLGFLWRELPLLERIRRAGAAGFDAAEFHFPYDTPAATLRAALAEAGLPAVAINTRPGSREGDFGLAAMPGRESEARAIIDEALTYADAIGASAVHVMAGKPTDARAARRTFVEALGYAAEQAGAAGLTILIEPLNRYDAPGYLLTSSGQAIEIIAGLGRENVKLMFDCYHMQINEGDLMRRFSGLLPKIGHVQIAAVPSRAEPGEGEIAYERLLPAFEAAGYGGFVGAEYRPRGTVEEGLGWLQRFRGSIPSTA
jgi:hydroxypyruvate isomerase